MGYVQEARENHVKKKVEEALRSKMKQKALKECDHYTSKYAECAMGRTLSVVWHCRKEAKDLNQCLKQYTNDSVLEEMKKSYMLEQDNKGAGCITCWCPCITFGQIAEIVDRGSSSCAVSGALYMLLLCVTGCSCLYSCFYRSKMRGQYFLEETPCADCLVHCCCEPCAMCQEYRELKSRGFDLSIGWKGNLEKQNRGLTLPPAIEGGMRR